MSRSREPGRATCAVSQMWCDWGSRFMGQHDSFDCTYTSIARHIMRDTGRPELTMYRVISILLKRIHHCLVLAQITDSRSPLFISMVICIIMTTAATITCISDV